LALARRLPAEIVCADSRVIYRGLDIGTAKPSRAERAAVPHHLVDVADPNEIFTLTQYQRAAEAAVAQIRERGRVPLLVGGTGLYLRAVVDGFAVPAAPPDWALRACLEDEERVGGPGTLHRRLAEVDPAAAARVHPRNVRRIIRALEVYHRTGAPISALQRAMPAGGPALGDASDRPASGEPPLMVALTIDRGELAARIDRRIDQYLAEGLVEEVRRLLDAGYPPTLPALQAVGYKELIPHVTGLIPLDVAVGRLRQNTRRYAKRQWTWLRADPRYRWIDVGGDPPAVIAAGIHAMMTGSPTTAHDGDAGRP